MKQLIFLCVLCVATTVGVNSQIRRGALSVYAPVTVVGNLNHPTSIAVDDSNIYWVSDSGSTIQKLSKLRGDTPAAIVTGKKKILKIAVDAESVYFITPDEVGRVNKTGGPPAILAKVAASSSGSDLVVDETNIYFMIDTAHDGEQVAKVSKAGGEPVILASGIYAPNGLASDGVELFWASYADGAVSRVNVNGGVVTTFGRFGTAMDITLDETSVYCACFLDVVKLNKLGGPPVKVATSKLGFIKLEMDQTDLYAISYDQKSLVRISKSGGRPVLLANFRQYIRNFAVDASSIYWTDADAGKVMSLHK